MGERNEQESRQAEPREAFGGNTDLAAELRALDAAALEAGITDEDVLAALDEDDGQLS